MAKVLITALGVLAVLVAVIVIVPRTGAIDVAATGEHLPLVDWFLSTARETSIHAGAEQLTIPPSIEDPERLRVGLVHYHEMCVTCHGAPGVEPSEIGKGLNPAPPSLYAEDDEEHGPAETFWVTKHGIRMTGMPAFGVTHGDEELWDIAAFVAQLPEMDAAAYSARVEEEGLGLRDAHAHAGRGDPPHAEEDSEATGHHHPPDDSSSPEPSEHDHSEHEHGD